MNCQDALDLLHEIIDKEATEIDTQQVKEHLDKCRDCFEVFRLEESVQKFLDEKIKLNSGSETSSEKLESLRLKISDKLNQIDSECPANEKQNILKFPGRIIITAASLVILIGAGFMSANFIRHYKNYQPFEQSHMAVVEMLNSNDAGRTIIEFFESAPDNQLYSMLSENINGLQLIGGGSEEIFETSMNHAVYTKDNQTVSLFAVSADNFEIPADLIESKVVINGATYYKHHCEGCNLVFIQKGRMIFIAAARDNLLDLRQFIPDYAI